MKGTPSSRSFLNAAAKSVANAAGSAAYRCNEHRTRRRRGPYEPISNSAIKQSADPTTVQPVLALHGGERSQPVPPRAGTADLQQLPHISRG